MATSSTSPKKSSLASSTSSVGRPPQAVKFGRRTSSGRVLSLSRDDDMDLSGDFSGNNDYINYTVLMPPTPDNQPMEASSGGSASADSKPDAPGPYGVSARVGMTRRVGNDQEGGISGAAMEGMDRRMSTKGTYGIGNAFWSKDDDDYGHDGVSMSDFLDKPWKPLTRKLQVPAGILSPYRLLVLIRLIGLLLFIVWRIRNPNRDAMWLWGLSTVCETWFAFSWLLDQLPSSTQSTAPPTLLPSTTSSSSPPLPTPMAALTSPALILPREKLSCYISDDGAAILTFEAMAEAVNFAEVWVPFCRKHNIEPRNPDSYFSLKSDPTKNKKRPDFVKDRRWIKREYDEFKVRINGLPEAIRRRCETHNNNEEMKEKKLAREKNGGAPLTEPVNFVKATWMADGTHWPGTWYSPIADHFKSDHAGILQVMSKVPSPDPVMGHPDDKVLDFTGVDIRIPMFAYVSREKRPGYDHNKKAGAMNAMVRASAILSNGPFILNLDCDHYVYNSMAVREGMCFMMDRGGDRICYIQFPQRFEGIDPSDRYANHNTVFFDDLPKKFGNSSLFTESIAVAEFQGRPLADHLSVKNGRPPGALLVPRPPLDAPTVAEAVAVISCWYEDNTEWGDRIGWIYGSVTEDVVTGYRMHNRGWRSVYCITKRDAFRGTAPINLTDRLHQVLRWATGSVEIFFSRNNVLLASRRLKFLQRVAYLNVGIYPFTSIFLVVYCFLPALSLLTGQFIVQSLNTAFLSYLLTITITLALLALLEVKWSGIGLEEWWRNEQFWVIGGSSAHLAAVLQGLLKVLAGIEIHFTLTSKSAAEDEEDIFADLYVIKWTSLFIMPLTIMVVNIVALVIGISRTVYSVLPQWNKLVGGSFFSFWVLSHMYPFAKGLMGRRGRMPTIVYVWTGLISITVSLLWISVSPPDG
ncbi:Cellulose synthase-like protein D4 [Vitis vinifera]|uniref:Cellulose synthase-like protein D4 n=1 Tax=Vitis vinifera TaxID=29760 RepID=A0A438DRF9_VITVI|nr:Cellulose synthase-like protein D4 [Vitis vinifera]